MPNRIQIPPDARARLNMLAELHARQKLERVAWRKTFVPVTSAAKLGAFPLQEPARNNMAR